LILARATTWLRGLAAVLGLAAWATAAPAATQMPGDPQGPYILVEAETGDVLDHFDALRPWYPASTTKLMTIYVTFRAILAGEVTLDSGVVISDKAAAEPASKMGFKPGTVITLDNALKIMMVKSANDIAMAIAEAVGGSEEGFATRMNAEAQRLGMTRSTFVNPNGLPDARQVTTARDMAILARALLAEFPAYRDYYRIPEIQLGEAVMKNFNPLLERYAGAIGMKTGFICASGYNLVASARRGEREMIAVVFGAYGGKERAERAAELLDEGFQTPLPAGSLRTTLANVSSGEAYMTPLDMRPFVCSPDRAATASEANTDGKAETTGADSAEAPAEAPTAASHLGPPIFVGPPVKIFIGLPGVDGKPGLTSVARVPRPRPQLPTDGAGSAVIDAFAPSPAPGETAPAGAIGAALGAAKPLKDIKAQ
jgi:D-alanyl-D-alanine carboxypeptidase